MQMTQFNLDKPNPGAPIRVGIDIGGTFTDFVVYDPEEEDIQTFKVLSSPNNPAETVLKGLDRIISSSKMIDRPTQIIHGSTVATNALLERKGAITAFIATRGFGDILQIGRQNRLELYNFFFTPAEPLIPADLRFELDERVDSQGQVLVPLDQNQLDALVFELTKRKIEAVAICFLFSFLHPAHEQSLAEKLRTAGFHVSASNEILPEYREFERASTTAINAYVSPVLDRYLQQLEIALPSRYHLRIMQSNGGNISTQEARRSGVRCILSGPAGGVIGARFTGSKVYKSLPDLMAPQSEPDRRMRIITFDMGGTSTDVSLIDGEPQTTTDASISGYPIRIPILDIHTIGAGGGSIAHLDAGGALRVGPESAGADPGPACYGKGDLPTVTDANLVLGRLLPQDFLGGEMPLDAERAYQVLSRLGEEMGLDAYQAALGIIAVANAHMERALRLISVERGHDPRHFSLLAFGGAGGLHAVDLARSLGIPTVIAPPLASTLSAFGMLAADVVMDYTQTVMLPGDTSHQRIMDLLEPFIYRGKEEIQAQGIDPKKIKIETFLDMRYSGQSYELTVPFTSQVLTNFHASHQQTYGYSLLDAHVEIVNLRIRATGLVEPPSTRCYPIESSHPDKALIGCFSVVFSSQSQEIPFFRAEQLRPGNQIAGPAVLIRSDTTLLIGHQDQLEVDPYLNLIVTLGRQTKTTFA